VTAALVSTGWAEAHLDDPDVIVIEVDEDASAYHGSHVPGAVAFDWRADLQDPIRRTFVDGERFAELLDERGVTNDTHVLLYGGNNNWFAAYAYWYLKLYGHERVSLIDGGRVAWEAEGRPLTDAATEVTATTGYRAAAPDPSLRARRDEVLDRYVGAPEGTALIDVRSPAEFAGDVLAPEHLPGEAAQVPGHIPGAANVPWGTAVDPATGRFLPVEELRDIYAAKGVTADKDVTAYCRIGERSAHTWFVLHELLGYERVKNYDGSWTEYGSLVDVPVERGA
jgi:thiosulfate/3-mercaptopyruvate sulfurtransferase